MQGTMAFSPLAPGSATALVLVGVRVSGLFLVAPVLSSTVVPRLVRVGLIVLVTVLLQPAVFARTPDASLTLAAVAGEALLGLCIGFGAALIVGAAEMAGDVMAVQIGLSGSAILDPLDPTQLPVLGVLCRLFAVTLLLTFDLHHEMLGALVDSFVAMPPGDVGSLTGGLANLVQSGAMLFTLGVRFAAPVIATVLLANIALAILTRAAPQINLLSVSFPIQIALGLFTLAAALPAMARSLSGWASTYQQFLARVGDGFALSTR